MYARDKINGREEGGIIVVDETTALLRDSSLSPLPIPCVFWSSSPHLFLIPPLLLSMDVRRHPAGGLLLSQSIRPCNSPSSPSPHSPVYIMESHTTLHVIRSTPLVLQTAIKSWGRILFPRITRDHVAPGQAKENLLFLGMQCACKGYAFPA